MATGTNISDIKNSATPLETRFCFCKQHAKFVSLSILARCKMHLLYPKTLCRTPNRRCLFRLEREGWALFCYHMFIELCFRKISVSAFKWALDRKAWGTPLQPTKRSRAERVSQPKVFCIVDASLHRTPRQLALRRTAAFRPAHLPGRYFGKIKADCDWCETRRMRLFL